MKSRVPNDPTSERPELRLSARAVSRGVASGPIVCIYGNSRQYYRRTLGPAEIRAEVERIDSAFDLARKQLDRLVRKTSKYRGRSTPEIFDAHRLILSDGSFYHKIRHELESSFVNAEWATKVVVDDFVSRYKALDDDTLRGRYIDLQDVGERLQNALGGTAERYGAGVNNCVIVASELRPSTLIELADSSPAAVITENGGWTSHSFIISRELNLPAVTGIGKLLRRVRDGEPAIVDGFTGEVIVNPTKETIDHYKKRPFVSQETSPPKRRQKTLKSLDGRSITIRANADNPSVYARAKRFGAKGIGLFRSEYLFGGSNDFPSEHDQVRAYSAIADAAGDEGVKIRTFDLNQDAIGDPENSREKNPALGLRGVRLSLASPLQCQIQLRALLIAAGGRNVDIVIPMVSGVAEIKDVSAIVKKESRRLRAKKIAFGEPRLGAMIEVPSAVITIDQILQHVDFISLGTNDLVQYLVAADRDNESVAEWFASLHPGVLRAIKSVIDAAEAVKKEVIVCGEMAGSPFYVPVLLGLGVRQLSMNANSISSVSRLIAGIAFEEARDIAARCLQCQTPSEVENVLVKGIKEKWGPLFPNDFDLPGPRVDLS